MPAGVSLSVSGYWFGSPLKGDKGTEKQVAGRLGVSGPPHF